MDGLAKTVFAITSAALMGYSFALLLVVKKKASGKKYGNFAKSLPLFPMIFIFYFALDEFAVAKEAIGVLAMLLMFYIGYHALKEVQ